tara:strand:- start:6977 stop:8029 length:1053 start_codon:yes stop_codon:yes gene_type:complete
MNSWKDIAISKTDTIKVAIEAIDRGSLQLALVIDHESKLVGTISDGDIRRALLKGASLDTPVSDFLNYKPITVSPNHKSSEIKKLMNQYTISKIPIIDENNFVMGLHTEEKLFRNIWEDRCAVIMCGGLGRRLGELTQDCPKPLLRVGKKPILETIIENFAESGCKEIYLSVNYKSEMIKQHFGNGEKWDLSISYLEEETSLGTAGSLSLITKQIKKPFIVMNGDILTKINFENLIMFHNESNSLATVCVREYDFQVPYGVVNIDGDTNVTEIIEKPVHSFFISAGVYILSPEILSDIESNLYLDMPTLLKDCVSNGQQVSSFPIKEYWVDIGKIADYEKANIDYGKNFK